MITFRHRGVSAEMPELFGMFLPKPMMPHLRLCVLAFTLPQIHILPLAKEIGAFNLQALPAAAGPVPAFLDDLPHQVPVPNRRATEALRQLAIVYLHDPNSIVAGISMEPGQADELMMVIAVRLTDL
jgi:hypothetical protein